MKKTRTLSSTVNSLPKKRMNFWKVSKSRKNLAIRLERIWTKFTRTHLNFKVTSFCTASNSSTTSTKSWRNSQKSVKTREIVSWSSWPTCSSAPLGKVKSLIKLLKILMKSTRKKGPNLYLMLKISLRLKVSSFKSPMSTIAQLIKFKMS